MVKKFEGTGNTLNEAFQKINGQLVELGKTETVIFLDLRKYGNSELGYKMVLEYKTK